MTVSESLIFIRDMQVDDLDRICEIEKLVFPDAWTARHFLFEIINDKSFCSVMEYNHIIVGYMVYMAIADEVHLNNIAVHPDYRRRGLGSQLLDRLLRETKTGQVRFITLEVHEDNYAAQALYRSRGFEEVGLRCGYYEHDSGNALIMTKYLKRED